MSVSQVRRKALLAGVLAFALTFSITACGDDDSSAPSTTAGSADVADDEASSELDLSGVRLRVGVIASTSGFRQAIYDASGVYDGTAYEIVWSEFESANDAVEALVAGAIDMTVTQQPTVVVLRQGNASTPWTADTAPFTVVGAEVTIRDPGFQVLVRPDSGIESVADLAGQKVTYAPGAFGQYFLTVLARDAGLEAGDYEEVQLPAGEGRAAFASGAVDALVTGYRNSLPLLASGDAVSLASANDTLVAYSLSLVRRGLLGDPAVEAAVGDLLVRVENSQQWHEANLDRVTEIYETVGNLAPDEAREAAENGAKRRVRIDAATIASLQDQADVFLAAGVISNEIDVSIMFDDRFNDDVDD
jgi:sulfonate transport system substrate-binding protein